MKNKQEKVKTYSLLYPTVRLGFGSHRTHKLNFINLFNRYYWRSVWYDFKQACLRFTRGYDDSAVYGMDEYLQKFILRGLLDLADNHIGVPSRMSNINKYWGQSNLSFEESDRMWTQKLVDIAENFYESMEWEESKYEKNEFETAFSESFEWDIDDVSGNIIHMYLKAGIQTNK